MRSTGALCSMRLPLIHAPHPVQGPHRDCAGQVPKMVSQNPDHLVSLHICSGGHNLSCHGFSSTQSPFFTVVADAPEQVVPCGAVLMGVVASTMAPTPHIVQVPSLLCGLFAKPGLTIPWSGREPRDPKTSFHPSPATLLSALHWASEHLPGFALRPPSRLLQLPI